MAKTFKDKSLRERFDAAGFGVVKYARAHNLCQPTLSLILNEDGTRTGTHRSRAGLTKKIYAQLKKDSIWIGALPWEDKK